MDVGVRELKQRFSEFLRLVEAGETIRVTDRGVPKAVISPIDGRQRLEVGIEEGWIRPPQRHGPVGRGTRHRAEKRVADLLKEDRGE